MKRPFSRRFFLQYACASILGVPLSGCGTVLHPERRGQPAGRLDWKIVALNGLGLLFFFVPGVIAFAVDFTTGAIYLPPGYYGAAPPDPGAPRLTTVPVPSGQLTRQEIERTVSRHVGRPVRLDPGTYETREMESIEEFWENQAAVGDR